MRLLRATSDGFGGGERVGGTGTLCCGIGDPGRLSGFDGGYGLGASGRLCCCSRVSGMIAGRGGNCSGFHLLLSKT